MFEHTVNPNRSRGTLPEGAHGEKSVETFWITYGFPALRTSNKRVASYAPQNVVTLLPRFV